jgi:hypothetical protein
MGIFRLMSKGPCGAKESIVLKVMVVIITLGNDER